MYKFQSSSGFLERPESQSSIKIRFPWAVTNEHYNYDGFYLTYHVTKSAFEPFVLHICDLSWVLLVNAHLSGCPVLIPVKHDYNSKINSDNISIIISNFGKEETNKVLFGMECLCS